MKPQFFISPMKKKIPVETWNLKKKKILTWKKNETSPPDIRGLAEGTVPDDFRRHPSVGPGLAELRGVVNLG